jgi:hypothetical protein
MLKSHHNHMITLKALREFTSNMHDDTKIGIENDGVDLVFREPNSSGVESLIMIGRLDAHGSYPQEEVSIHTQEEM